MVGRKFGRDRRVVIFVGFFTMVVMMALRWEWNMMQESKGKVDKPEPQPEKQTPDKSGKETEWGYKLTVGSSEYWNSIHIKCKDPTGSYKMSDLKKHSDEGSLWLLLRGYVFDVTQFRPNHPGGDIILTAAGEDASEMFELRHQPFVANMLGNFCIGKMYPSNDDEVDDKNEAENEDVGKRDENEKGNEGGNNKEEKEEKEEVEGKEENEVVKGNDGEEKAEE